MNDLTIYDSGEFETIQRMGMAMVESGYFKDAKDVAQATVKIMAGRELGLPPFASMTGIHIITGKPTLGANVIATLVKNDPRYDYRVKTMTDTLCEVVFFEGGQQVGVSSFSADDARRAKTQNMAKVPRNMLFARALTNGAKWYVPGIFGGAPVYTPDELGGEVDYDMDGEIVIEETGEIVDDGGEPEPVKSESMRSAFHATGTELYGKQWKNKRPTLVAAITDNRTKSSTDLTYEEMSSLLNGMKHKLADKLAAQEE